MDGQLLFEDGRYGGRLVPVETVKETLDRSSSTRVDASDQGCRRSPSPPTYRQKDMFIKLNSAVTHAQWTDFREVMAMPASAGTASFVGVGRKYTSKVLGWYVVTKKVPPGDEREVRDRGRWQLADVLDEPREGKLGKKQIIGLRHFIVQEARMCRPVTSKRLRGFLHETSSSKHYKLL